MININDGGYLGAADLHGCADMRIPVHSAAESVYKWGKNKDRRLRFSKSNDEKIVRNYATHFIDVEMMKRIKDMSVKQAE